MFYEEISDDYLVCLYREKNQDAIDLLFERYRLHLIKFINGIIGKQFIRIDYDELFQDLMLVFIKCIESYDEYNGYFYCFVKSSVERKVFDYIKKYNKEKRVISLDQLKYNNGKESVLDYVAEEVDDYSFRETYDILVENIDEVSKKIVDLKIAGYTYKEMSNIIGVNKQAIYRRVNKIKNILKDIIEKID